MKNEFRLILSTAPDHATAKNIATALVTKRLVACVNLLPHIESIYQWQGKVESASEVLLVMKTTATHADAALAELRRLHPYEVPEGIVLPITAGLEAYLGWISTECDSLG